MSTNFNNHSVDPVFVAPKQSDTEHDSRPTAGPHVDVSADEVPVEAGEKVARFMSKQIVVEQDVDLPRGVEYARNGARKNASKWTRALAELPVATLSLGTCGLMADSVIDMPRVLGICRDRHLTETTANNLVLGQLVARVLVGGVLFLENERIGHVTRAPILPATQAYADDGTMLAEGEREIASFEALRVAVFETVKHTLALGGAYQESIVATGVIDPVLVRPTVTHLRRENVRFTALETVDGTTRAVTNLSVALNTTSAELIADFALRAHFGGHVEAHDGAEELDITDEVRGNIRAAQRGLDNDYWAVAAECGPADSQALRVQQALSMPATLTLQVVARSPKARTFVEALDVLVRNTHINRRPWLNQAEANNLAKTVVTALIEHGSLSDAEVDLLYASTTAECAAALAPFGYTGTEDVDATLWRATVLLSVLTRPGVRSVAKKAIGQAVTLQRVRLRRYSAVISLLLDLPWRESKVKSSAQGHRAWERGGALLKDMLDGPGWQPSLVPSVETLVEQLDQDAQFTLAALGGVALIADRFITSDAVAGTADAGAVRMPYKVAAVNTLVEMLARKENVDGRRQLAATAKAFDPAGESSSPWRSKERSEREDAVQTLRIANAKALADGRVEDVLPLPVYYSTPAVTGGELKAETLMRIADYDNAMANKHKASGAKTGTKSNTPKSPLEQVIVGRSDVLDGLESALAEVASLSALANKHDLPAFNPAAYREAMTKAAQIIGTLQPMSPSTDIEVSGDLDVEDLDDIDLDADEDAEVSS